jgi:hypothetical protein
MLSAFSCNLLTEMHSGLECTSFFSLSLLCMLVSRARKPSKFMAFCSLDEHFVFFLEFAACDIVVAVVVRNVSRTPPSRNVFGASRKEMRRRTGKKWIVAGDQVDIFGKC